MFEKKLKLKLFLTIFLFVYCLSLQALNIRESLKDIPKEDVFQIDFLFHHLIEQGHFAYTLFDAKPVSLYAEFDITFWGNTLEGMPSGGRFWNKWAIWEKYKNKFPLKNYLLIKEKNKSKQDEISTIFLINKKEFIKIVNQHLGLFQVVTGNAFKPEEVLKNLESGQLTFRESIKNSDLLLGVLLGFGVNNSVRFSYFSGGIFKDAKFIGARTHDLQVIGEYEYSPLIINSVYFAGDLTHSETQFLKKKYKKFRGKISKIYSKGDFLEITLSKLTSE
jgi:hypothetical protein